MKGDNVYYSTVGFWLNCQLPLKRNLARSTSLLVGEGESELQPVNAIMLLLLLLPFFRHWETLLRVDWATWRACNYLLVLACSLTLSKPTFGLCAGAILPGCNDILIGCKSCSIAQLSRPRPFPVPGFGLASASSV